MILQPPSKNDFAFDENIEPDIENRGFSAAEVDQISEPYEFDRAGAKGIDDLLSKLWKRDRDVPPEIQNLKSEFGYQSRPFLTDLIAVAEAQNTELSGMIKARASHYNFYIMPCGVYIAPDGGEKFEALKFEVRYKADDAATFSMMPGPEVKKILSLGGKADIGVTGKVDFGFPQIPLETASVDASAKAELEANFIVSFSYELKTQVVDAYGVQNSFCRWLMHKGDKLRNDVVFYPIIMTPKSVTGFECEFRAFFKIGHPDWKNSEFFLKPPRTVEVTA